MAAGMKGWAAGNDGGCAGTTRPPPRRAYPARIAVLARAPFALRKGRAPVVPLVEGVRALLILGSRVRGNDG